MTNPAFTLAELTNPVSAKAIIDALESDEGQQRLVDALRHYGLFVPRALLEGLPA